MTYCGFSEAEGSGGLLRSQCVLPNFIPTVVAQCGSLGGVAQWDGQGGGREPSISSVSFRSLEPQLVTASSLAKGPVRLSVGFFPGCHLPFYVSYHKLKVHVALTRHSCCLLDFPTARTMSQDKPFSL